MGNPYRRLKRIVNEEAIDSEELLHALVASVFSHSCDSCNQKFHSEEFSEHFRHLVKEIRFCRDVTNGVSSKRQGFLESLKRFAEKTFVQKPAVKARPL